MNILSSLSTGVSISGVNMSYYRYITGIYKSYRPELNRTLRSSSVPRHVPQLEPGSVVIAITKMSISIQQGIQDPLQFLPRLSTPKVIQLVHFKIKLELFLSQEIIKSHTHGYFIQYRL